MAKNNINLGTLSGKLGDNVFWRTHGQQRVRTYFKREETHVGYEAANRRAQFANLKSIYQFLPDIFRQACNLYRVGGNPYADFMRQYTRFSQCRDKEGFGAGRFLPVNCSVSNGTFGCLVPVRCNNVFSLQQPESVETLGLIIPLGGAAISSNEWGDWSSQLLSQYPWLRTGDKMHVMMAHVTFDIEPWGQADAVAGFPFAYSSMVYASLTIDPTSNKTIYGESNGVISGADADDDMLDVMGLCPSLLNMPPDIWQDSSLVGAIMFERPTNTRQMRFSPSQLVYNRSQLEILSPTSRGRWNEYCTQSYMKNG